MKSILIFAGNCILTFLLVFLSASSYAQELRLVDLGNGTLAVSLANTSSATIAPSSPASVQIDFPVGALTGVPAITYGPAFTVALGGHLFNQPGCSPNTESLVVNLSPVGIQSFAAGSEVLLFSIQRPTCPVVSDLISLSTSCNLFFGAVDINDPFFTPIFASIGSPSSVSCDASAPLPIEMTSFIATKQEASAHLEWETSSELNNSGFAVQRSNDGSTWVKIGWVDGSGTTRDRQNYSFVDDAPNDGNNYYRLEQIDFDGKTELSDIRNLVFGSGPKAITVFPNPTYGRFTLDMPGYSNGEVHIRATDATGRVVFEQHNVDFSNTRQEFDFSKLGAGAYQLNVRYPQGEETVQLMIMRN